MSGIVRILITHAGYPIYIGSAPHADRGKPAVVALDMTLLVSEPIRHKPQTGDP